MEKVLNRKKHAFLKDSALILITAACAVLLPQVLHAAGVLLGVGGALGQMFLPMYLPVLILGFKCGAVMGAVSGLASPLLSFSLTGMPTAALLPFITVELICFGAFAGLFANKNWSPVLKVLAVAVFSKLARTVMSFAAIYFISGVKLTPAAILNSAVIALPGLLLQLILVPYIIKKKSL